MSPTFTIGLLRGAALAVAGAAALGAGSAFAVTSCSIATGLLSSCNVSLGNYNISATSLTGGGAFNGRIDFGLDNNGDLLISTSRTNGSFLGTGSFNFTLVPSTGFLSAYSETTLILNAGQGGTFLLSGTGITSTPKSFNDTFAGSIIGPVTSGAYSLSWSNITGGSNTVRGFESTFSSNVPVPLPIVGAGLAFGFTRKLRKRAQSVA